MKIRLSELRKLIREELVKPLGNIAFDPQRKDRPERSKEEIEPNTEVEDDILKRIVSHIAGNYSKPDPDIEDVIRQVILSGEYSDMLRPPDEEYVYRGMGVDEPTIKEFLGIQDVSELQKIKWSRDSGKGVMYDTSFLLHPEPSINRPKTPRSMSSWTSDLSIARKFAHPNKEWGGKNGGYAVILYASTSDNLGSFLDLSSIYGISNVGSYSSEKETIGFGSIRISKVEYLGWEHLRL